MPENVQARELLIFDRDCGFCTACVKWGRANLKNFPTAKGFQDLNPIDFGLTQAQVQHSIWLIRPNQPALPANLAASAILRNEPNYFWRILGALADTYWIQPFAKRIYFLVAANRHRLPGATEYCELPKNDK